MLERGINESPSSSFDNDDNLTLKTKRNNFFSNLGDVLVAVGEACSAAADRYEEVRKAQEATSLSNDCWKKAETESEEIVSKCWDIE